MKTLKLLIFGMLLLFAGSISAQVTGVNYQLKYDTVDCQYDALLIINAGATTSNVSSRIQFNSQFSIVVPTTTTVTVDTSYMPLLNNSGYAGTVPLDWTKSTTVVNDPALPGYDLISITPFIDLQTFHYNDLTAGDTVKLFSLSTSPITMCGEEIRMFENGVDPSSSDLAANSDFSNGFTMGSPNQIYEANSTELHPPAPTLVSLENTCGAGIEIDLTAFTSVCQGPLQFAWEGPNSFTATTEDISIIPALPINNGTYQVTITDAFGCTTVASIEATSKPNAGADEVMCAGETITLSGTDPTTGTWSQLSSQSGVTLNPLPNGEVQVSMDNGTNSDVFGDYVFIYEIPGCEDTMSITVNPKPLTLIQGADNICVFDSVQLIANIPGGEWSSNNPGVATINPVTGFATGVSSGTATFTYTTLNGCTTVSPTLTINPSPVVTNSGQDTICVGNQTQLTPGAGGEWTSLNSSIATITEDGGLVTGVSEGTVGFQFEDNISGCLSDTIFVTVVPVPEVVFIGNDSLCVGGTTQVSPTMGVSWVSSNTSVIQINNSGVITGIGVGQATVTVTDLASGCVSAESAPIYVLDAPDVAITGDLNLCIGEFSQATPTTGGVWTSEFPSIATITNAGVIEAIGSGPVTFTFVDDATGCEATTETLIVDTPPTVGVDDATICISATTTLQPATGGSWVALEPDTASVSGAVVTGIRSGIAGFIYTSDATGCASDTVFVTVEPGTPTALTDTEICIGETTVLDSNGEIGAWTSSNTSVATVINDGTVTGVGAGTATFTFTSNLTLCESDPTPALTVHPAPILTIDDNALCIGEMTFANSTAFGGSWSVTDGSTDVATINPFNGEITAVGDGSVTFTFVDGFTGCSTETGILVVNQTPDVSFTGPDEICESETTTVGSSASGTWVSLDTDIAEVDNNGTVTGAGAGTTQLVFTDTDTGCSSDTLEVTVIGATAVTDPDESELCIGETTFVLPNTGGTWSSSNGTVAEIHPTTGVITAISNGSAFFTFTADGSAQCASNNTAPVLVHPNPTIVLDATEICVGDTIFANTVTAGMWTSTDPTVASIDDTTGEIVALMPGTTTFTFVDGNTGCTSDESLVLTVGTPAPVTSGASQICVGEETTVFPTTGGTWVSSDPAIASVDNNGLVTGITPGSVVFYYTEAGGCVSAPTDSTEVTPGPDTDIGMDDELCIGETLQILPAAGGTWVSADTDVATITDGGLITAVGPGITTFTFTSSTTGCNSLPTDPITVNGPATTIIDGSNVICIGATTNMLPNSGGTWVSSDSDIATIDNNGLVTGVAEGTVTFIFTPTDSGCPSDPSAPVSVSPTPDAEIFDTDLCIGATTLLMPNTGGTWASSDPTVASVLDNGEVTAIAPGVVTFTFTETASGCASASATAPLTITDCINPDFNATFVNIPVDGDVSTNDGAPVGTTYDDVNKVLTSSPAGAVFELSVNSDGTYTFVTDVIGVYTWDVPACIPPLVAGCQTAELVITVVDFLDPDNKPIANVDIASTDIDTPVEIFSLDNDKCVVVGGCDLDPNITIVANPANGSVTVDALTGNTTYTPNSGFVGHDTLRYEVCVMAEPTNCAQAYQIITILSGTSVNSTLAADDFNSGGQDTPITGNVSTNDTDPQGDDQTVTAGVFPVAGVGTLTLAGDGSYTFIPEETFYGPVDFPYTTCDDNVDVKCADATLHLLVVRDLYVQVRVYLEGAFIDNDNEIGSHLRPLMRDDLRESSFTGVRYIPDEEPYAAYKASIFAASAPRHWETIGDFATINQPFYRFGYDSTLVASKFRHIPNPSVIFATSGEDAVTDWVSVELRSKSDFTQVVAQRSGLVQRDGDVIDLNGELGLRFSGLDVDNYYVVVRHRNHLGAMTADAKSPAQLADLIDFTVSETGFFDFGATKNIYDYTGLAQASLSGSPASNKSGYLALWGGDFDADGKIKFTNPDDDLNNLLSNVFGYSIPGGGINFFTNFDFAFGYQTGDYDMNSKSKFDNPNDDKNYLFAQLLFYPLNSDFRSNFDFFIEQVPENIQP